MSSIPSAGGQRPADVGTAHGRRRLGAHAPLLLILAGYALLAAAYGAAVPLGEAPDELAHYRYVRTIDATGRPPMTAEEREASGYKGHEPPLYYLLLHRVTGWMEISRQPMLKIIDPDLAPRHSMASETPLWNAVLHTADEAFPWRGTALAWHLMRLVSIPLGMATILGVYRSGRILAPERPHVALLAAGLTAFTPQFVYLGGAVNNDNLAIPLSTLALATLVAMAAGDLRWRRFLLVGVLAGLARLAKFHTLVLLPVIVVSLIVIAWRLRAWGRCILGGALALAVTVLVSAPWILAVQPDGAAAGGGLASALLGLTDAMHAGSLAEGGGSAGGLGGIMGAVLDALRLEPFRWAGTLFRSYWAFFGQMTVAASPGVYLALAVVVAAGAAGAARLALRRQPIPTGVIVLVLGALAYLSVAFVFYALMRRLPDTAQGRHLYPALPAWALLLAVGLLAWVPERHARRATAGLLIALAALAVYVLPAHALAAYEPALPVSTALPAAWQPELVAEAEAAPGIAYLGCTPAVTRGVAGQTVDVDLLWRATAPVEAEYLLRVEYANAGGTWRLIHLAQPAGGRWPTRAWDPGDYVRDRHAILIPPGIAAGEYPLRTVWADAEGHPIGTPVEGCCLSVEVTGRALAGTLTHRVPPSDSDPLCYRQGIVVAAPPGTPHEVAADPASGNDGAWLPIATEVYPTDDGDATGAFYVVGPDTRPGRYVLSGGEEAIAVRVDTRERRDDVPDDMSPGGWRLGDDAASAITLAGYRLEGDVRVEESSDAGGGPIVSARPGETIGLSLAWRAEGWVSRNYTVFTHLVAADGAPLAQHDGIPQEGYATLFWAPGEVVVDYHPLTLPPGVPAGEYRILVGLYTRPDGVRLPVAAPEGWEALEATAAVVATVQVVNQGER